MFIPTLFKPQSDILVIFDYPSVNDSKGHIQDSNMKRYFAESARKVGVPISNVSYYSVIDYALGRSDIEEFYITEKKQKTSDKFRVGDFYFQQEEGRFFHGIVDAIKQTNPKIIVCCSKLALILFANSDSLDAFRGSMLMYDNIPVLVTYSPMDLYTRPELHLRYQRDLIRVQQFLAGLVDWAMPTFNVYYGDYDFTIKFLNKILTTLSEKEFKLSVDIETRVGLISFIGIAVDKRTSLVIPFITWDDKSYWTYEQEVAIVLLLRKILSHVNARIIGQNFQYDLQYIVKHWGVLPVIWRDTMVEAHANWTKGQPLSLAFLSSMYCDWYRYWKEDGKDFHKSFQTEANWNQYALYNGYDTCYTYEVADKLEIVARNDPARTEVREFQRKMQNIVIRPVLRGLRFDKKKQLAWKAEYEKRIASYEAWLDYIIPDDMITKDGKAKWYNSPTRMVHFFYKQLGLEPVLDKKSKKPTVGGDAFRKIAKEEPILRLLMQVLESYVSIKQFHKTYLKALESEDGFMRTQYMLGGTDTFRLASKKDAFGFGMNLQNTSKG